MRVHILFAIASLLANFAAHSAAAQEPKSPPATKEASQALKDAETSNLPDPKSAIHIFEAKPTSYDTFDYIVYEWWECRVEFNEYCNGDHLLPPAPLNGWQACKVLYQLDPNNYGARSGPNVAQEGWFTDDPLLPPSFSQYHVTFRAEGSWDGPFHPIGALMRLNKVGLRLIPAVATSADRMEVGCDLPTGPK